MLAFALAFVVTPNYNGYVRQQRPLPISATAVGHDPVGAGQGVSRLLWTSSMTSYLPADGQVLGLGASSADAAFELNCVSGGREREREGPSHQGTGRHNLFFEPARWALTALAECSEFVMPWCATDHMPHALLTSDMYPTALG